MRRSSPRVPSFSSLRVRSLPLACVLASSVVLACSSEDDPEPAGGGSGGAAGGTGSAGSGGTAAAGSAGAGSEAGSGGSAGTGSAAAAICPEGSLFCDDFEGAAAGALAAPWRTSANQATVVVDTVQAFNGTNAVHVNAPQAGTYHRGYFALDAVNYPGAETEMYGRAMVYLPVLPNADVHWTFIQGEGLAADGTHNALYRYGGQHQNGAQLMANYETNNNVATDCWDHSASLLPTAQWTCVEWHFTVATNDMQFWMNGTELTDIHVTGAGEGCGGHDLDDQWIAPPQFQTLYLGWEHYQQTMNPIDLWMDAVVVDTKRIGCPAAP